MPSSFTDAALGLIGYPINYTTRQQRRGRASLRPSLMLCNSQMQHVEIHATSMDRKKLVAFPNLQGCWGQVEIEVVSKTRNNIPKTG